MTFEQVQEAVLSSARVQAALEKTRSDSASGAGGRDDARKTAKQIFASMYADVQQPTVRTAIYAMRKVWRSMYEVSAEAAACGVQRSAAEQAVWEVRVAYG